MKFAAFTKSFQDWDIPTVCQRFREIGLEGLDLTVRRKGHIEPVDVPTKLPAAARAVQEAGMEISFLTTDITDATPEAEQTLATASGLGIDRFKLGYYRYKPFGNLAEQIDETRKRIDGVVGLGKKHGILPCLHVHSGPYIPSHGTLLYELIRNYPPGEVGAYVDMLHMVLEGGKAGWQQGLDLLAPWISLVAVKNFWWEKTKRDDYGQQRWATKVVPIAEGISPLPDYVKTLQKAGYDGVYSLHSEYKGSHSFQDMDTEGCLKQTATDLAFFKGLF